MSGSSTSGITGKFKHYSLNILIIIIALLTAYLFYNFVKFLTTPGSKLTSEALDSNTVQLTKQPSASVLQIDVRNGSGVNGIADKFTEYLRSRGFDVVEMGNFSTSDIKTSMVIDRAGSMANARKIARSLGINEKYVIQQMNKNYFLDATVVIGKDYNELNPMKQNKNGK